MPWTWKTVSVPQVHSPFPSLSSVIITTTIISHYHHHYHQSLSPPLSSVAINITIISHYHHHYHQSLSPPLSSVAINITIISHYFSSVPGHMKVLRKAHILPHLSQVASSPSQKGRCFRLPLAVNVFPSLTANHFSHLPADIKHMQRDALKSWYLQDKDITISITHQQGHGRSINKEVHRNPVSYKTRTSPAGASFRRHLSMACSVGTSLCSISAYNCK